MCMEGIFLLGGLPLDVGPRLWSNTFMMWRMVCQVQVPGSPENRIETLTVNNNIQVSVALLIDAKVDNAIVEALSTSKVTSLGMNAIEGTSVQLTVDQNGDAIKMISKREDADLVFLLTRHLANKNTKIIWLGA